jgi:hypothetical protein
VSPANSGLSDIGFSVIRMSLIPFSMTEVLAALEDELLRLIRTVEELASPFGVITPLDTDADPPLLMEALELVEEPAPLTPLSTDILRCWETFLKERLGTVQKIRTPLNYVVEYLSKSLLAIVVTIGQNLLAWEQRFTTTKN